MVQVTFGGSTQLAAAQAAAAAVSAATASSAANVAETARDVAVTAGPYYTSTATGEAATTNGQEFAVAPGDGSASWYRRTLSGSDLIFSMLTTIGVMRDGTSGNYMFGDSAAGDLLNNNAAGAHNGDANTGFGFGVFADATSAYASTAVGYVTLGNVTTGHSNTAYGYQAGAALTTGVQNTLVGVDAGYQSTAMNYSVVVGHHCLNLGNFAGTGAVIIGQQTARNLTAGADLIVIGRNAMANSPATGSASSTVIGGNAAIKSSANKAVLNGTDIMQSSAGSPTRSILESVILGYRAMFGVETSSNDAVVGAYALFQADGDTMTSSANAVLGANGGYLVDADSCVFIGSRAGAHSSKTALSGVVVIGPRAADVAGGASALSNNDFVLSNSQADASRLLWGSFSTGVLNTKGVLNVGGNQIRITTSQTPASAAASGTAGTICWDSSYIYVCTATNTWKRVAIATW